MLLRFASSPRVNRRNSHSQRGKKMSPIHMVASSELFAILFRQGHFAGVTDELTRVCKSTLRSNDYFGVKMTLMDV